MRAKPNTTYRYGYQIAPYIVFFQSKKAEEKFKRVTRMVNVGSLRERNDGVLEYTIGKQHDLLQFVHMVKPYVRMKQEQLQLLEEVLALKAHVSSKESFQVLLQKVQNFATYNYSKKRKVRILTP